MFFHALSTNFSLTSPSIYGFVEVSALAMLIGSSAAASLALGSRGPAGLAWAATSAFGIIAVAKACLSAATPGWFRETIGVRSSASDLAVGLPLDLEGNAYNSKRVRKTLNKPIAIQCRGDNLKNPSIGNDIYAYDYSTSAMIHEVPDTKAGETTRIFTSAFYDFRPKHENRIQIGIIGFSFLKLTESYVFWRNNSNMLAIVTSIPWCHFLIFAIVTEILALKRAKYPETTPGMVDILAGKLPAVKQSGGSRKIIIGAAQNFKCTLFWKIMWSLGAIMCIFSTLMTYSILGRESKEGILLWAEFQALWMGLRMLVHHVIPPDDPLANRQLAEQSLPSLSHDTKKRIMRLTIALSRYQIYSHPRGEYCYPYDCFEDSQIPSLITRNALEYPKDSLIANITAIHISIKAVIGDTTLSSASWIAGSKQTPMELYDSCVVVFNMTEKSPATHSSLLAIPAVRVLSGRPFVQAGDPEKIGSHFAPKGASNDGYDISWRYWIPLDSGQWVFLTTPDNSLDICRQQTGNVMSNGEVAEQLAGGTFNIGLSRFEDIQAALEASRQSFMHLQSIFTSKV